MKPFGYHSIIDASEGDVASVTDPEKITKFAKQLVYDIDMEAWGEPQVFHFGEGEKAGWTLIQPITTSSIVVHFMDDGGMYADVFSCKEYDPSIVINLFVDFFGFKKVNHTHLIRKAP